ncbi:O-antigen polysaccharide polymerase Wzy [Terrihalobacillus insolitus]|uniref:O-antigen polysaccharide polymerase Wzy n=1 Tax=Terrihalobacillus insolitus TaxID=2950438 RepID=UPI0023416102|nr:O-antigen polysaccharide polymerase Wzy [Terrihalobacillus insolitus]MDC3411851.1 O-antigen polysaccharide polymerase Wzy family protein [Terrihalobacillus insolitus]
MNEKYNKSTNLILFLLGLTCLNLSLIVFMFMTFSFNFNDSYLSHLILVMTFILLFIIWNVWFSDSYVDIVNLLLAVQFVFFGGNSILKLFNFDSKDHFTGYALTDNDYVITNSIIILAILFFVFGAAISKTKKGKIRIVTKKIVYSNDNLNISGLILLIVGMVSFLIDFDISWFVSSYKGFGETTLFRLLWSVCLPTSGFVYATSNKRHNKIIGFIVLLFISFLYILMGNRGYSISLFLTIVWLYDNQVKKISKVKLIFTSLLIIFIIGLFFQMKEFTIQQKLSIFDNIKNIQLESVFLSLFEESSVTYRTLIYTIQSIPLEKGFDWGLSYLWAFTTIIPNIFGTSIHPSLLYYQNPSEWIAWTYSPIQASLGYGFGFSNIGEAYFNFGLIGVIIVMFIFGFFIAKLSRSTNTNSLNQRYKIIITAILISNIFWSIRNSLSSVVRDAFYQYILLVIILVFIKMISKKKKKSRIN